jgi:hypothetical protein
MRTRQLRRRLEREAAKRLRAAEREGFSVPDRFACPKCKGTGRRWWIVPFVKCRICRGDRKDPMTVKQRLAQQMAANIRANVILRGKG